jgi:hypothetical protein
MTSFESQLEIFKDIVVTYLFIKGLGPEDKEMPYFLCCFFKTTVEHTNVFGSDELNSIISTQVTEKIGE